MSTQNWIEIAQKAFQLSSSKLMHVEEIARKIQQHGLTSQAMDTLKIQNAVTSALANHVKKKGKIFSKSATKGKVRGYYRLKNTPLKKSFSVETEFDLPSTNYTGRAGEHSVLSELLFRGFNASLMSVDEGVDIVASRNNKYFHIQVKTANPSKNGTYGCSIPKKSFQHGNDVFYIFVLRRSLKVAHRTSYANDLLIFASNEIRRLIDRNIVKGADNYNFSFSTNSNEYYLSKTHKVSDHVNDFTTLA